VDARLVAREYWLKPIFPERMPYVAAELLASGYDSPSLREAAGVSAPLRVLPVPEISSYKPRMLPVGSRDHEDLFFNVSF
jgi:hypothetical protein